MASEKRVILVTGGSGLVGQGIRLALESSGKRDNDSWIFLSSKDADLRLMDQTRNLFEKYKPTHVIHLAAIVGGLFKNMRNKLSMFRDNWAINDNVLWCAKEFKIQKCISMLSTCVFPDKIEYPLTEQKLHNGPPHFSNEGYAYAKRMVDVLNRCYHEEHSCNFSSIIPTNIYGPYDNYNLEDSHVLPGLIHKCYLAQNFVIWGSGKPLRQFVYSVDLGRLIVWALDNYNEIDPLTCSVSESEEISISQAAESIAKAMNFQGKVVYDTSKADGQFKKTASNEKLLKLNPDFKFTPYEEAIKKSVQWFLENYDSCRK